MKVRPAFELADVFNRHGEGYERANAGHLGRVERRVIGAITACRTAALGGHVEQCDDCGAVRIAYNSCLMGTSVMGSWRGQLEHAFVSSAANPALHYEERLRSAISLSDG